MPGCLDVPRSGLGGPYGPRDAHCGAIEVGVQVTVLVAVVSGVVEFGIDPIWVEGLAAGEHEDGEECSHGTSE